MAWQDRLHFYALGRIWIKLFLAIIRMDSVSTVEEALPLLGLVVIPEFNFSGNEYVYIIYSL